MPPHSDSLDQIPAPLMTGLAVQVQVIDRQTLLPAHIPAEMRASLRDDPYSHWIQASADSTRIEIHTPYYATIQPLRQTVRTIRRYLSALAGANGVMICGGGCHPLAPWTPPTAMQLAPVFSLSLRIGCPDTRLATYLCTAWQRYLPHLIALAAASPFLAGQDTECATYRAILAEARPDAESFMKGHLREGQQGIEISVCDAPLNLDTAVDLAAYAQSLSAYLLAEVPDAREAVSVFDDHQAWQQAARFSFDGLLGQHEDGKTIGQDIQVTLEQLRLSALSEDSKASFDRLEALVSMGDNDAAIMRAELKRYQDMSVVVARLALRWASAGQHEAF